MKTRRIACKFELRQVAKLLWVAGISFVCLYMTERALVASGANPIFRKELSICDLHNLEGQLTSRHFGLDYRGTLAAFGEPQMQDSDGDGEVVRFLWFRSFHNPICVSAIVARKQPAKVTIFLKELKRVRALPVGQVEPQRDTFISVRNERYELSEAQGREFVHYLEVQNLQHLPPLDPGVEPIRQRDGGLQIPFNDACDGALWVLESRDHGVYRVALRENPTSGRARNICLKLLRLAHAYPKDEGAIY
jgi:hypothetical protein